MQMQTTIDELAAHAEGLLYISESESSLTPFLWENPDGKTMDKSLLLQLAGKPADTPVEEVSSLADFIAPMVSILPEYGTEEKARAKGFLELQSYLEENLSDIKVFRTGRIQIDCYIVGKKEDGDFAGLKTTLIET